MPANITPTTMTLDKIRIEQFTVSPQKNAVMIHYSKGYNDTEGNYVPKEYTSKNLIDVEFDPTLYEQVKTTLYNLLTAELSS